MRVERIGRRAARAAMTVVATALVAMGVAACQPAPVPPPRPPTPLPPVYTTTTVPADPAPTVLEVTHYPSWRSGGSSTYTVRCGPGAAASVTPAVAGLTARQACATVEARRTLLVEGPPPSGTCLQMIFGPQSARVKGHVGDAPVDRWFSRSDSCQDRIWWQVAGLFPPTPRD